MPVSDGLQAYFDAQGRKRWTQKQVVKKLAQIETYIDPKYQKSFEDFRMRILNILSGDGENHAGIIDELTILDKKLASKSWKYNLKKTNALLEVLDR